MKNKKPIIALGALAVVGLIAGTIAYFTSEAVFDNVFKTAVYKTQSTEVFESPQNWVPGQEVPKTVTTTNLGTIPVAVRISTSENWQKENGTAMTTSDIANVLSKIPSTAANRTDIAIINFDNANDWTQVPYNGESYYYYKKALQPNGTTSSFIKSVTLNPDLATVMACPETKEGNVITKTCTTQIDGLGKATYTLTLTIETVQYDQYKTVWFDGENIVNITES